MILLAGEGNAETAYSYFYKDDLIKISEKEANCKIDIKIMNIGGCRNVNKIKKHILRDQKYKLCIFITDADTYQVIKNNLYAANHELERSGCTKITPILSKPCSIEGLLLKCLTSYTEKKIGSEANSKRLFKKVFRVDAEKLHKDFIHKHKNLHIKDLEDCHVIKDYLKLVQKIS